MSAGKRFRQAIAKHKPLQVVGAINAYAAILAERSGHRALYLSGGGLANASLGLPDLGVTTMTDVLEDARRITAATELPLLVDIDTGWGGPLSIVRTIREMIRAEVAGVHIEDQESQKRCGHRPNKSIVPKEEMVDRVKAAVGAKTDPDFIIMARTDALAQEGIEQALERACAYVEAGADMIFPEAVQTLAHFQAFADACQVPILANITEFGKTPLFTREELKKANISLILYPVSAFRAMSKAALEVYNEILLNGTQKHILSKMQTREELYLHLNYHFHEQQVDKILKQTKIEEEVL